MTGHGKREGKAPKRRMNGDQIEELVIAILRLRTVRSEAVRHLKVEHFNGPGEAYLGALWGVLKELHAEYPQTDTIPYPAVYDACREVAFDPASGLGDEQRANLLDTEDNVVGTGQQVGIIAYAYRLDASKLNSEFSLKNLRRFLDERGGFTPIVKRLAAAEERGIVLPDVSNLLEMAKREVASYTAIGTNVFQTLSIDIDRIAGIAVNPTGLSFFDHLMDGGSAEGEVIGVLGPTGGGKSTLMSQLAVSRSQIFRAAHLCGGINKVVLYFTFEDAIHNENKKGGISIGGIYVRCMAYRGSIDRNILEKPEAFGGYTRTGKLRPYEVELFGADGPGERERLIEAMADLKDNLSLVDMRAPGRGYGGIAEVRALIEQAIDRDGITPGTIIIDSMDRLAQAHLYATNQDVNSQLRRAIVDGMSASHDLAREFDCDVWVTNQLEAKSNKRAATARAHHSDATDAKGWANAADMIWVFNPHDSCKRTTLTLSKGRRGGFEGQHEVIQLDGRFSRWRDIGDEYTVSGGNIVLKNDKASIVQVRRTLPRTGVKTIDDALEMPGTH